MMGRTDSDYAKNDHEYKETHTYYDDNGHGMTYIFQEKNYQINELLKSCDRLIESIYPHSVSA